jgi:23S rRNA (uracil1939-C5)-methyltransferase
VTEDVVTITGIAAGGDGVGRLADGRAVFVPRAAPGDRVALDPRRLERRRSFARGAIAVVRESGADRVAAACPHYERDRCGGCQLQHLAYPAQLAAKRRIVGDTLRRIGKLAVEDPEIEPAPAPWRYRATITLAARGGTIGYQPYDAPGRVFELEDCHIADERLMALWHAARARRDGLPDGLSRLTLRLDREGRRHVIAESAGAPWLGADRWRSALPDADGVVCWWQPVDGAARVVAGPETGFPATAFEHVHPVMGRRARDCAVMALGDVHGQTVWDLYGGVGDTARLLAERGADVVSVDADEGAVAWARTQGAVAHPIRYIAGRAEDVVARLDAPAAAVVNPPRAGLHWDVTLRLTADPVPRLVYRSCDPATLARDLARLSAVYRLADVRAFDLFPQTAHVETVAVLEAA